MPKRLTEPEVEHYRRDGFMSPVRMFSERDAAELRREFEQTEAAMGGALKGISRTKIYLRQPFAYRLATHQAILDVVEDLIGPDIMLYQSAAWVKNAGEDSYVSWHQDNTYFGHDPCEVLSVWLALTPSQPESGAMRFLPGSHKLGMLPVHYEPTPDNLLSSGQVAEFDAHAFTPFACSLSPGEASIHHAWMVHGSAANRGSDRRIGVTFVYHPPHLRQTGAVRTSAMVVRGEDCYRHFDHERPPVAADDPETIARHERGAALYRAKARELGNRNIGRLDE